MKERIFAATMSLVLPVLAVAQAIDSRASNAQPVRSGTGIGTWILLIVLVAAIAIAFWGYRSMRRRGPHGPQAPTPRGP